MTPLHRRPRSATVHVVLPRTHTMAAFHAVRLCVCHKDTCLVQLEYPMMQSDKQV